MEASAVFGTLFVVIGVGLVFAALPITHHIARLLPQWHLTRGDVERLASTTFLTAWVGMLMAVAGVAMILFAAIVD